MGFVSQRLRDSAKGQECTLQLTGICNRHPDTTVLAHLPSAVKGVANKGDDWHAIFACADCHRHMDLKLGFPLMADYQLRALQRTQKIWFELGLLSVAGEKEPKPKQTSKSLPAKRLFK